jgi:dihydroorotate dehydrogenase electron transfer subunit
LSRYFTSSVLSNIALNPNHNLLTLSLPEGSVEPLPGQFYMIEVNRGTDPLLKRAFSLFRRTPEGFQLMYRIRGRGTSLLREMKRGDALDVLGPLGSSYPVPSGEQVPLVVAGGIGIASVFSFVEAYPGRSVVLYGARSGEELFMLDELKGLSREMHFSTDDGTMGTKGSVAESLNKYLEGHQPELNKYILYACGPHPMLKAVSKIAALWCVISYVSMEEHMACGLGACLGCVVKTHAGQKRVCKEGPVFSSEEIVW